MGLTDGLITTLEILAASVALTTVWSLVILVLRISNVAPLRWLGTAYIEVFRGTPILVQLFTIFFGLTILNLLIDPIPSTIIVLTLNTSSYLAENYRSGLATIPKGQREAAAALGMSKIVAARRVIMPQVLRVVIPTIGNITIQILLSTPVSSTIGTPDLLFQALRVEQATRDLSVFLLITLTYAALAALLAGGNALIERKLRTPRVGTLART